MRMYESRGLRVTNIYADPEFLCIKNDMLLSHLNVTAANEHVGEIKRSIRATKEISQCITHNLPLKWLLRLMVRSIVCGANIRLNDIPAVNGVSNNISPTTIVGGHPRPDYHVITKVSFGTYAQVNDDSDPTNGLIQKTTGVIALNPVVNGQGYYYFMSLATGERLNRRSWTELSMGNDVIAAVDDMDLSEGQPVLDRDSPLFK